MTKFSDEFINKVKQHWEENKGKPLGNKVVGIHREYKKIKKFGMQDLAEHFNITFAQATRIIYHK